MQTTPASHPLPAASEDASSEGLKLARRSGEAYRDMVEFFLGNLAMSGDLCEAGELIVAIAVEPAEPLYELVSGELRLVPPTRPVNTHLEVMVMDAVDQRFVPELRVTAELAAENGERAGPFVLPFVWHPTMYHYGANVHLPCAGEYRIEVHVDMPTFARRDEVNGKRFTSPIVAAFERIHIEPRRV